MPSTSLRKHTLIFKLGFHKRSVVCLRCEIKPAGWESSPSPSDKVTPSPPNSNHPSDWKRRGVGSPSLKGLVEFPIYCCVACAYNVLRAGLRNSFLGDRSWTLKKVTFLNDFPKRYLSPFCLFVCFLSFFQLEPSDIYPLRTMLMMDLAYQGLVFCIFLPNFGSVPYGDDIEIVPDQIPPS